MAALRLELCIADVSHWMAANRLKLNPYKTELLCPLGWFLLYWAAGGHQLQLREETITASDHMRLLGVTISSDLSSEKHVSHKFDVLLLASPASTDQSITRH